MFLVFMKHYGGEQGSDASHFENCQLVEFNVENNACVRVYQNA